MLRYKIFIFYTLITLILIGQFLLPSPALPIHPLLKKIIIAHNLKALEKSLIDGSYRGEEGVLRIRPEIGKSLGMKVFIDQDYLESRKLFKRADSLLEEARRAMVSQEKEKFPGEHAYKIADHFLLSKRSLESAQKRLMAYRQRLNPSLDDRLNEAISTEVMDRLFENSLKKTGDRLRDALGSFYNLCQGEDRSTPHLTPENVPFVNDVIHHFMKEGPEEAMNLFDLDRDDGGRGLPRNWKSVIERRALRHIPLLEASLTKFRNKIYAINPLLFIALMKKESSFNPLAISPVGAAGLTQIMPKTGKELGMKNIYKPGYFSEALSLSRRERKAIEEAEAALFQINEKNKFHYAGRARELMQQSLILHKKSERLFARYKRELLKGRTDDRLRPALAVEYGVKYFARLMKNQNGDISLALASYNAGPHRVREFKGIPPYPETVLFRNDILKYYREYLAKAKAAP